MDGLIYLDNGATSYPKPEEVYTFMDHFYRKFGVNPGRSGYDLCMESGEVIENTRKQLMNFFNGKDPNRLVFSYNCGFRRSHRVRGSRRLRVPAGLWPWFPRAPLWKRKARPQAEINLSNRPAPAYVSVADRFC